MKKNLVTGNTESSYKATGNTENSYESSQKQEEHACTMNWSQETRRTVMKVVKKKRVHAKTT